MVYRFVRNSSGAITVTSEVGKGTRVQVFLPGRPCATSSSRSPAVEDQEEPGANRTPRRLIYVDDESTLRQLATRVLGPQGYEVLTAENGQDALALWREHGGFDLAILDIVMPGMGGEELCLALRELDPGLPVIFTSGYAGSLDTRRVQGSAVTLFLAKPFTPNELIQAASQALAAASS
jgi:two-component system cell cycle sensor histidine kinase/response regulator CckA